MKKNKEAKTKTDELSFTIKSYWLDFQAHPNHSSITPSIVLSSTHNRNDKPSAIVYFHYSADFKEKSTPDSRYPDLFYLHYHISMLGIILELLKSGQPLKCYMKPNGRERWGGINLIEEILLLK